MYVCKNTQPSRCLQTHMQALWDVYIPYVAALYTLGLNIIFIYNVLLHLRSFACITLVDATVCCHLHQQLFDAAALLHQHLHFLGELVYLSLHLLNGGLYGEMGGGGGERGVRLTRWFAIRFSYSQIDNSHKINTYVSVLIQALNRL